MPFPSPGDLLDPGIKHRSPALQADSLPSETPGKPEMLFGITKKIDVSIDVPCDFSDEEREDKEREEQNVKCLLPR